MRSAVHLPRATEGLLWHRTIRSLRSGWHLPQRASLPEMTSCFIFCRQIIFDASFACFVLWIGYGHYRLAKILAKRIHGRERHPEHEKIKVGTASRRIWRMISVRTGYLHKDKAMKCNNSRQATAMTKPRLPSSQWGGTTIVVS